MSKAKKGNRKQSHLSNKVLSRRKKYWLRLYHKELSPLEIEQNIGKISKFPEFYQHINLTQSPNFPGFYNYTFPYSEFKTSLAWCIGVVLHHKKTLKRFRELEKLLQDNLLVENYDESLVILNKIDEECGVSTWALGIRASVLKISKKEKEYTNFIHEIKKNKNNALFNFVFKYISEKYEDSSIHISLLESLRKQLMRFSDHNLKNFLLYKITPKDYLSDVEIDYHGVFLYERKSSVIDIYKALISYVESFLVKENQEEIPSHLKNTIIKLHGIVDHPIINNAVLFYNLDAVKINEFNFDYSLMDLYTCGEYQKFINLTLNKNLLKFSVFEMFVKSLVRLDLNVLKSEPQNLKEKIISNLCSVLLRDEDFDSSYSYLVGVCFSFSEIPWFQELLLFVVKEAKFIGVDKQKELLRLSALNSPEDTPRKLKYLSENVKEQFINYLDNYNPTSITANLFIALEKNDIKSIDDYLDASLIDPIRLKKYKVTALLRSGNEIEAIRLLKKIIERGTSLDIYDALHRLVNIYISNQKYELAIQVFVNCFLDDRNKVLVFDISKIAFAARELLLSTSKCIEIPISLLLYCKYVDDFYESALRVSIDNFLQQNDLNSPLELFEKNLGYSDDKINYFLENVCTPSNMKLSLYFDNKKEIDDCRIKICNGLIERGVSKEQLSEETKNITKEDAFKQAVAHVDKSRIFVDTTIFKDVRSKNFKDLFNRFCELKKIDYSDSYDEQMLLAMNLLCKHNEDSSYHFRNTSNIMMYMNLMTFNEKNRIFYNLIQALRDEFTFGDKGLNSYLSTRIRHGVLPTALRKPVQNEHLWTTRDVQTGKVKASDFWLSKLSSLNDKTELSTCLFDFTKAFDEIINHINDSWLQIVTLEEDISGIETVLEKSESLFNYFLTKNESLLIQSLVSNGDYNKLIDVTLSWLWYKTDVNLEKIRYEIEFGASDKFKKLFDSLETSIQFLLIEKNEMQLILSAIRKSREGLVHQLKNVTSWFRRSIINKAPTFEIITAINIASRSTDINVDIKNILDQKILGRYLSSFVDIFYIIFENALSKSKLDKSELLISIDITIKGKDLVIVVENNNLKVHMDSENERLEYYRKAYGNNALMAEASQQEGGTGIFKIYNIVNKDFGVSHQNDFGYVCSDRYRTEIILHNILEVIFYESTNS